MQQSLLVEMAERKFKELGLAGISIEREKAKKSSHSHHIVTYPPLHELQDIQQQTAFPRKKLALYAHLPFCTGKCIYCKYYSLANQPCSAVETYLKAMQKEVNLLLELPQIKEAEITSVYFGGGTPTCLNREQLTGFIAFLKKKFDLNNGIEFTCEASPETIAGKKGKEKLSILLKSGVNRLSIGVQSFDDKILALIKRRHNAETAVNAIKSARQTGFDNINIDLMPGLPCQAIESWENDLEKVEEIMPPSITTYPLTIKEGTAIQGMLASQPEMFPSEQRLQLMQIMSMEALAGLGYKQNPIWWFTLAPKYIFRQQLHKWQQCNEMLGLGVAAYSFMNNCQYFNFRTMQEYLNALAKNRLPLFKGKALSAKEQMQRAMVFGVKTEINKQEFKQKFGFSVEDVFPQELKKLESLGLLADDGKTIKPTCKGCLFSDEMAKEFYSKEKN